MKVLVYYYEYKIVVTLGFRPCWYHDLVLVLDLVLHSCVESIVLYIMYGTVLTIVSWQLQLMFLTLDLQ